MSGLTKQLKTPNGVRYEQPIGLFINNEWVKSRKEEMIVSINPADETEITAVYAATDEDVDDAVLAARSALKSSSWRDIAPSQRGDLLLRVAQLVEHHKQTLASIETWDNGKPYKAALDEDLPEVISVFKYFAGYCDKIHGKTIDTGPSRLVYTVKEPVGVCGQIIPWNYPLAMAAWKLAPALACGNTVVLKAAEQTPLSILYLANLLKEAGAPPGVANILNGYGPVAGAAIARHSDIDKIAFTGSTNTARQIVKLAATNLKKVTIEAGGKSPLVVFEDAKLEQAVKWAHSGIMSNMGQICSATSRILVQEAIYEDFLALFCKHISDVSKVGDPFETDTSQGPQVTKAQFDRILQYIESGKSEGAKLVMGGKPHKSTPEGKGFYVAPTVFRDVKQDMKIFKEEIFGPVVVLTPFETETDAINIANDSIYGLGASVFTRDISKAHRVARRIESGVIWINSSNDYAVSVPFGGFKQSGIGSEMGEAGLEEYTNTKSVYVNLGDEL